MAGRSAGDFDRRGAGILSEGGVGAANPVGSDTGGECDAGVGLAAAAGAVRYGASMAVFSGCGLKMACSNGVPIFVPIFVPISKRATTRVVPMFLCFRARARRRADGGVI